MTEQVKRLRDLLVGGLVLYVLGVGAVFLAWPSSGTGLYDTDSGSTFWTFVGSLAASIGGGMALVALIGWGVKFGREAAKLD
jgi:hypothetical protein